MSLPEVVRPVTDSASGSPIALPAAVTVKVLSVTVLSLPMMPSATSPTPTVLLAVVVTALPETVLPVFCRLIPTFAELMTLSVIATLPTACPVFVWMAVVTLLMTLSSTLAFAPPTEMPTWIPTPSSTSPGPLMTNPLNLVPSA